jgi:hypothetical protein
MKSYAALISGIPFEEEMKKHNQIATIWLLYYEDIQHEYLKITTNNSVYKMEDVIDLKKILKINKLLPNKLIYSFGSIEKWLVLIETVQMNLPLKLKIFLMLRQSLRNNRGRQGWTALIQWKFSEEYARVIKKDPEEVWIEDRNTWTRWWDKVVNYTVRLALKNNLLD